MLLVPKQLLRSGMTGNVPYYGGRFSPAQAYAASHPTAPPMTAPSPGPGAGRPPAAKQTAGPETRAALDHLRESGLLTATEYADLLKRIDQ